MIPKPQDAHSQLIEPLSSPRIVFQILIIRVLLTIQLNRHPLFHAIKIDNKSPDRILPPKLMAR